jgi:hypothetical protein
MSDNPGENTRHQNQIEGVGSVSAVQINPRTCTRNDKQELKRIDSIFSVRKRTSVTMFVKKKQDRRLRQRCIRMYGTDYSDSPKKRIRNREGKRKG